ncbi:hypothetical protein BDW66DRAFT_127667 [Aspergillus desertorum]
MRAIPPFVQSFNPSSGRSLIMVRHGLRPLYYLYIGTTASCSSMVVKYVRAG